MRVPAATQPALAPGRLPRCGDEVEGCPHKMGAACRPLAVTVSSRAGYSTGWPGRFGAAGWAPHSAPHMLGAELTTTQRGHHLTPWDAAGQGLKPPGSSTPMAGGTSLAPYPRSQHPIHPHSHDGEQDRGHHGSIPLPPCRRPRSTAPSRLLSSGRGAAKRHRGHGAAARMRAAGAATPRGFVCGSTVRPPRYGLRGTASTVGPPRWPASPAWLPALPPRPSGHREQAAEPWPIPRGCLERLLRRTAGWDGGRGMHHGPGEQRGAQHKGPGLRGWRMAGERGRKG